jgi:hypothetical protein
MTDGADEWKENDISINGFHLTVGEAMTFRVAVTHFHQWLENEGLGDDEHGKAMVAGYRRNCESMLRKMAIIT